MKRIIIVLLLVSTLLALSSCRDAAMKLIDSAFPTEEVTRSLEGADSMETERVTGGETAVESTEPMETEPTVDVEWPDEETDPPAETTNAPVETTKAPVETTKAPVEIEPETEAPATTPAPATTTAPPVTTEPPVTTAPPVVVPTVETINVPPTEKKSYTVDKITQSTYTAPAAEILSYTGVFTYEDEVHEYTYTVVDDGTARIWLSEMKSGMVVELYVYDAFGQKIATNGHCSGGSGITLNELEAGNTYTIQISQYKGLPSYQLNIGQPKAAVDISTVTVVKDSIEFEDQCNVYTFTVPRDGRYRFEISGMKSGNRVGLYVYDYLGYGVASYPHCSSGKGVTVYDLVAGDVYTISVDQYDGYDDYTLSIGLQKPSVDISNLTEIKDSIEYTDQRNVYPFTIPVTGRYRFEISGMTSGMRVELYIFNTLGETVGSYPYCTNGKGVTLKGLQAGETYKVQVRQYDGKGDYTLNIGKQKPSTDVSSSVVINDSIEHVDQRNVYNFVADRSGTHTFTVTGLPSGYKVELYAFNELGETVASDTYCVNGDYITLKNLKVGDAYEIQVRYSSGFSSYTLTIK